MKRIDINHFEILFRGKNTFFLIPLLLSFHQFVNLVLQVNDVACEFLHLFQQEGGHRAEVHITLFFHFLCGRDAGQMPTLPVVLIYIRSSLLVLNSNGYSVVVPRK